MHACIYPGMYICASGNINEVTYDQLIGKSVRACTCMKHLEEHFFRYIKLLYQEKISFYTVISLQHTNADGHHGSTAAPIAVGGHNTDSVYHIVGHSSDYDACSTGGECTNTWTDSDGVVNWSPTIILCMEAATVR